MPGMLDYIFGPGSAGGAQMSPYQNLQSAEQARGKMTDKASDDYQRVQQSINAAYQGGGSYADKQSRFTEQNTPQQTLTGDAEDFRSKYQKWLGQVDATGQQQNPYGPTHGPTPNQTYNEDGQGSQTVLDAISPSEEPTPDQTDPRQMGENAANWIMDTGWPKVKEGVDWLGQQHPGSFIGTNKGNSFIGSIFGGDINANKDPESKYTYQW